MAMHELTELLCETTGRKHGKFIKKTNQGFCALDVVVCCWQEGGRRSRIRTATDDGWTGLRMTSLTKFRYYYQRLSRNLVSQRRRRLLCADDDDDDTRWLVFVAGAFWCSVELFGVRLHSLALSGSRCRLLNYTDYRYYVVSNLSNAIRPSCGDTRHEYRSRCRGNASQAQLLSTRRNHLPRHRCLQRHYSWFVSSRFFRVASCHVVELE